MSELFRLQRFVDAQEPIYERVVEELRAGRKQRHWMWFIFPQIKGLGSSAMAQKFAISSRAEAEEYLAHPLLGQRLIECTRLMNLVEGRSAEEILGPVDAVKFRSSMTLFWQVAGNPDVFKEALRKYFGGQPDEMTLDRL
jgi:uncharacterized protein (DUF1810 family)